MAQSPARRSSWLPTLVAVLALLAFLAVTWRVFVIGRPPRNTVWLLAVHRYYREPWVRLAVLYTRVGHPYVLTALSMLGAVWLWLKRRRAFALSLAVTALGAVVLNEAFKVGFHEARPHLFDSPIHDTGYGYPSGHAMLSMAILVFVALRLGCKAPATRRILLVLGAVLLSLADGFSRIYLGVHWPTDVIAGFCFGLFWGLMGYLLDRRLTSA